MELASDPSGSSFRDPPAVGESDRVAIRDTGYSGVTTMPAATLCCVSYVSRARRAHASIFMGGKARGSVQRILELVASVSQLQAAYTPPHLPFPKAV
eukprot:scaffold3892_cov255-Pinguiococcus_pyrenoidosus.AAC.5